MEIPSNLNLVLVYDLRYFLQVDPKRLLMGHDEVVWLRIEDAGYMDEEGRVWLVGRVKWRVEKQNRIFWSTIVEQKVSGFYQIRRA